MLLALEISIDDSPIVHELFMQALRKDSAADCKSLRQKQLFGARALDPRPHTLSLTHPIALPTRSSKQPPTKPGPSVKQLCAHGFWEEKMSRLKIVCKSVFWARIGEKTRSPQSRAIGRRSWRCIAESGFFRTLRKMWKM